MISLVRFPRFVLWLCQIRCVEIVQMNCVNRALNSNEDWCDGQITMYVYSVRIYIEIERKATLGKLREREKHTTEYLYETRKMPKPVLTPNTCSIYITTQLHSIHSCISVPLLTISHTMMWRCRREHRKPFNGIGIGIWLNSLLLLFLSFFSRLNFIALESTIYSLFGTIIISVRHWIY